MATPRKHWHRMPIEWVEGPPWAGNDELAFLIRIMARMNTRWRQGILTADEAAHFPISASEMMVITRIDRPSRALKALHRFLLRGAKMMEWEIALRCEHCAILEPSLDQCWTNVEPTLNQCCASRRPRVLYLRWRKFAIEQRYHDHDRKYGTRNEGQSVDVDVDVTEEEIRNASHSCGDGVDGGERPTPSKPPPKPAPKRSSSSPPGAKPPTPAQRAEALWPRLVEESGKHGRAWSVTMRATRRDLLAKRLKAGFSEDDLVHAIPGWVSRQPSDKSAEERNKHYQPETVYKLEGIEANIDAGRSNGSVRVKTAGEQRVDELLRARERLDRAGLGGDF